MAPYIVSDGGWVVIKVTVVLIILDVLVLALRFLARQRTKASFGADDTFTVLAIVFLMGNVAANYWSLLYLSL